MDNRFANMFNLTEDSAIALLQKPLEELQEPSERYVAASHLCNFPTQRTIEALIATIKLSKSVNIRWLLAGYPFLVHIASLSMVGGLIGIKVPSTTQQHYGQHCYSN